MPLNQVYRKATPYVISFDWIDSLGNVGYVSFDAYNTFDSTGIKSSLVRTSAATDLKSITFYGIDEYTPHILITTSHVTGAAWVKSTDVDFDLSPFQRSVTIGGTAHIRMSYYMNGTASTTWSKIIVRLKKNDVEIASVTSGDDVDAANDYEKPLSLTMTVPNTDFKVGDVLRLTIESWEKQNSGSTTVYVTIAGDPQNEADDDGNGNLISVGNSRIILIVPFKPQN